MKVARTSWSQRRESRKHTQLPQSSRTAFAASYTFLVINGARITAHAGATCDFISGLYAANDFSFAKLAGWLRANVAL